MRDQRLVENDPRPVSVRSLAVVLVALIALVVSAASGAAVAVAAETGVAANNIETAAAVAADTDIGPAHVGSNSVVFDDWTSGCCVAPRSAPGGLLSEVSPGVYRSPGGLTYGPGSVQGHRTTHVLEHARPNPGKPNHSVFATSSDNLPGVADEVFGVIDEAWVARGAPLPNDPGVFVVPMGRTVGTAGETSVRIVVRPGTSEIITAYPT